MLTDLLKHIDYLHTLPRGDKKRLEAAYVIRLWRWWHRRPYYYTTVIDKTTYEARVRGIRRGVVGQKMIGVEGVYGTLPE